MMNLERKKFSLRKDDTVQVMAGREKGKTGKILKINFKSGRVTVEKVNLVKKHSRPTAKSAGGILEQELSLAYSNVLLMCPKCNRGVRHGHKFVDQAGKASSKKVRVCKRCDGNLDSA